MTCNRLRRRFALMGWSRTSVILLQLAVLASQQPGIASATLLADFHGRGKPTGLTSPNPCNAASLTHRGQRGARAKYAQGLPRRSAQVCSMLREKRSAANDHQR